MANSNYIQTRYYRVIENNSNTKATHLKAEIYYSLGGMNYFSSKVESFTSANLANISCSLPCSSLSLSRNLYK